VRTVTKRAVVLSAVLRAQSLLRPIGGGRSCLTWGTSCRTIPTFVPGAATGRRLLVATSPQSHLRLGVRAGYGVTSSDLLLLLLLLHCCCCVTAAAASLLRRFCCVAAAASLLLLLLLL
jgi:hypothetical protein